MGFCVERCSNIQVLTVVFLLIFFQFPRPRSACGLASLGKTDKFWNIEEEFWETDKLDERNGT